jgi:hypothetical protein
MTGTMPGTTPTTPDAGFPLQFVTKGRVGGHARDSATEKLAHLGHMGHPTVVRGRVLLTRREAPGPHPASAEATFEVLDHTRHAHTVHVESEAAGMTEAIDLLERRLHNAFEHLVRKGHRG